LIFPRSSNVGAIQLAHCADTALVMVFLIVYSTALMFVGAWFGKSVAVSIILCVILPFLILSLSISVVIFVHHTHFMIPWYASIAEWQENRGAIRGTVHVKLPSWARRISLNIMVHNAHHYAPGVPLYRLREMQQALSTSELIRWRWSLSAYLEVCARCKLFEFSTSQWTNFAAVATSVPLIEKSQSSLSAH
jgi:omega-6 fatty acid desaturase (delta-12 desaturase)